MENPILGVSIGFAMLFKILSTSPRIEVGGLFTSNCAVCLEYLINLNCSIMHVRDEWDVNTYNHTTINPMYMSISICEWDKLCVCIKLPNIYIHDFQVGSARSNTHETTLQLLRTQMQCKYQRGMAKVLR